MSYSSKQFAREASQIERVDRAFTAMNRKADRAAYQAAVARKGRGVVLVVGWLAIACIVALICEKGMSNINHTRLDTVARY